MTEDEYIRQAEEQLTPLERRIHQDVMREMWRMWRRCEWMMAMVAKHGEEASHSPALARALTLLALECLTRAGVTKPHQGEVVRLLEWHGYRVRHDEGK